MTCATCGSLGIAEDKDGHPTACACPAGDNVRTRSTVEVQVEDNAAAVAMDATIWCIQNQGRPESDLDPLPDGVTSDDILAALARSRIQANRRAVEAHEKALGTPLPKAAPHDACTDPDQQGDSEVFTGRVPYWLAIAVTLVVALVVLGGFALADLITAKWGR